VVCEALARANLDPARVDHLVFGCVSQVGEQTFNIARNVVLDAGLPVEIPATSLDFQCGSSQQAVHVAAAMVAAGYVDVVVAGGVESMTRVPMGSSLAGGGSPFTDQVMAEYNLVQQGIASDEIARKWDISRGNRPISRQRQAARATENSWFKREILPVEAQTTRASPSWLTATRASGRTLRWRRWRACSPPSRRRA
jgi:acetyl-CoA acyltransferase